MNLMVRTEKQLIDVNSGKTAHPFRKDGMLFRPNCIQWSGKKDKNCDYIPSSIKISFDDDSINEAIAAYMKYRDNRPLPEAPGLLLPV